MVVSGELFQDRTIGDAFIVFRTDAVAHAVLEACSVIIGSYAVPIIATAVNGINPRMCKFRADEYRKMELGSSGKSFALASCTTV